MIWFCSPHPTSPQRLGRPIQTAGERLINKKINERKTNLSKLILYITSELGCRPDPNPKPKTREANIVSQERVPRRSRLGHAGETFQASNLGLSFLNLTQQPPLPRSRGAWPGTSPDPSQLAPRGRHFSPPSVGTSPQAAQGKQTVAGLTHSGWRGGHKSRRGTRKGSAWPSTTSVDMHSIASRLHVRPFYSLIYVYPKRSLLPLPATSIAQRGPGAPTW